MHTLGKSGLFLLGLDVFQSRAFGLGKAKPPRPFKSVLIVSREYNAPSTVIPQAGKRSSDFEPASRSDSWGIFQEDESGSKLATEPGDFEK
jgi:hypothetical protein